ncbi:hypothetical protein [Belliella aquatica]|uniref:hypothetical protein n=1 Tax=Belliella aquatica TaxID=1323734 RepID=UPI001E52087A|nr:hypothetical protein [Belliella aquatica]
MKTHLLGYYLLGLTGKIVKKNEKWKLRNMLLKESNNRTQITRITTDDSNRTQITRMMRIFTDNWL